MVAWVGWLIAAGGLAVVELLTLAVVAGLLSAAAAVAAIVAVLGGGVPIQVVAFAAAARRCWASCCRPPIGTNDVPHLRWCGRRRRDRPTRHRDRAGGRARRPGQDRR